MLPGHEDAVTRARARYRSERLPPESGLLTGLHPVREALRARRRSLRRLFLHGAPRPEWQELRALAREAGVPLVEGASGGPSEPGGAGPAAWVWLDAGPLPELDLDALLPAAAGPTGTLIALDGVEDPQNVGAIVRVAEASGAAGLILMRRHAPPLTDAVARASAGAIEWLPVARVPNLARALRAAKDAGFWIVGADPAAPTDLFSAPAAWLRGPRVLVLGAEGVGLRHGVMEEVDHRVRIPMSGQVASLNVSTACAVLLFELTRRDREGARAAESAPTPGKGGSSPHPPATRAPFSSGAG
jgi:23S rRNA (guanosine2251-2'-O)-methyltransferase